MFADLSSLPYFNPDLDFEGAVLPPAVQQFRQEVAAADALVISTPEYAHGIPGVLKNALDWLVSDRGFVGKPVGLIFGSAGDASFARASLIEILSTMSARVVPEAVLSVRGARTKVDPEGHVLDESLGRDLAMMAVALSSSHRRRLEELK